MMDGTRIMKCTVNYSILLKITFPIRDIEICIKAPVCTLPTRQTASALKWACHAGNRTNKKTGL